jgi:hypothetical protein
MRTKLLLDSVDAWLLRQPSIIDKRTRQLFPVVQQRTAGALPQENPVTAFSVTHRP